MKAMILAAGLGKRMRPLTNQHPKPLLKAGGKQLIDYHLDKLAQAKIETVIINTHWLADQISQALGNGNERGLKLRYSYEPQLLETAGGIKNILADLSSDDEPFLVINGDVYTELDLPLWLKTHLPLMQAAKAYLAFVPNPSHNPQGDFSLNLAEGSVSLKGQQTDTSIPTAPTPTRTLTYSGIALFRPSFFDEVPPGPQALGPALKTAILKHQVRGGMLDSYWLDIGTPERLAHLERRLEPSS